MIALYSFDCYYKLNANHKVTMGNKVIKNAIGQLVKVQFTYHIQTALNGTKFDCKIKILGMEM